MLMRDQAEITKLTLANKPSQSPTTGSSLSRLRLVPTIAWTALADPKDKGQHIDQSWLVNIEMKFHLQLKFFKTELKRFEAS